VTVTSVSEKKMSFVEKLKHAFGIGYEEPLLEKSDEEAIMRVGDLIVHRRLEVPAIMALESLRPMNFLASQVMVMLQPFLGFVTDDSFFVSCQAAFEKRDSVNFLIEYLEDRLNDRKRSEKVGLSAVDNEKRNDERGVDGES